MKDKATITSTIKWEIIYGLSIVLFTFIIIIIIIFRTAIVHLYNNLTIK